MNTKDFKIDDEANEREFIESLGKTPKSQNRIVDFFTDFLTGFGALFILGIILCIVVPLLLLMLKVGLALALPIAILGAGIILIALLGKVIKFLIKKW